VSATVLHMSMSLDGFIAGPNEGPGNGLGDRGHRLREWAMTGGDVDLEAARRSGGVNGQVVEEFMSTGAVVAGRRTFEPAVGWGGDHHDGVPIWVFSRHEPGIDVSKWPLVTYVNDVTSAMTQAKEAAGDKKVLVHGAATARLPVPKTCPRHQEATTGSARETPIFQRVSRHPPILDCGVPPFHGDARWDRLRG
jgi:dihydrofolate reductase